MFNYQAKLVALAVEFRDSKLVTKRTIKERGWTDKLIDDYLIVDVFAKNPHYKTAGDMKLYCLSRIEILEQNNPKVKSAIARILLRRKKAEHKKQHRLELAVFKWLDAVGDPHVAIAILLNVLINKISQKTINKGLNELKPHLVATQIVGRNIFNDALEYCHYFNIRGYQISFRSTKKLKDIPIVDAEKYICFRNDRCYLDRQDNSDLKMLFKLSGWRKTEKAIAGLNYLLNSDLFGGFGIKRNVLFFSLPRFSHPLTENDLFINKLEDEHRNLLSSLKMNNKNILQYMKQGCPVGYICKYQGAINEYRCANHKKCKEISCGFN